MPYLDNEEYDGIKYLRQAYHRLSIEMGKLRGELKRLKEENETLELANTLVVSKALALEERLKL